ncbi:MAG: nucleotide exchange factor GrpE [Candidatus Thalassarchaeum betae]|uniref:Protein GrpE n=1 Tax=Candidatus Thalassarchaeum betae TaxID=2599289 RepID=A0A2V3HPK9_9ARCH|nr:MAG: nucleotide exchange factor GrpE [Candidatus Thalassoarchaea betae]HIM13820.1 nucleotide exchange factor GrpE [Candidatus Poseidoniales archaeon]HIM92519.1 nucleotide exchange factor GrpE [Candidatus Poseidoniales archaeon]
MPDEVEDEVAEAVEEEAEANPVEALEARVADLEKKLQYSAAEMVNVRQRARRERSEGMRYGGMSMALRMLPLVDSLEKALESSNGDESDALREGVRLTLEGAKAALKAEGVTQIEVDSTFDPTNMEAIATVPAPEGCEPGSVIEVVEVGYMYHDRVLRAARVIVAEGE